MIELLNMSEACNNKTKQGQYAGLGSWFMMARVGSWIFFCWFLAGVSIGTFSVGLELAPPHDTSNMNP